MTNIISRHGKFLSRIQEYFKISIYSLSRNGPNLTSALQRGGPFDIGGGVGVEENMEINKKFLILLKINKLFPSLLEINKLFLKLPEKMDRFTPKITCLQA